MLSVPVELAPSRIHGLGVFATGPIAAGAEVWRFTEGLDLEADPALVASQPEPLRRYLLHYGYVDARLRRYILCCDHARFINHSDSPNLTSDFSRDRHGVDVALRDIAAGEELTLDYHQLGETAIDWMDQP